MSRGGRGRGRGGKGGMTFNIESIGFGRGDALPASTLQPPPAYPPLHQQPLPLQSSDALSYMMELQKDFVKTMLDSPYYIRKEEKKNDVERYSDKYRGSKNTDNTIGWKPDWRRMPKELQITVRKRKSASKTAPLVIPNLKKAKISTEKSDDEVKKRLEELEKTDAEKVSDEEDSEMEEDNLEIIEEENEEENDYLSNYFDNGESYLDEEDDTLDEQDGGVY